jgi:hypothetical protein
MARSHPLRRLWFPRFECLERRDLPTFLSATQYSLGAIGHQPVIADFNGDNKNDIAIVLQTGGIYRIAILLGNDTGAFNSASYYHTSLDGTALIAADLNGDSALDLVTSSFDRVSVLLWNGDGTFLPKMDFLHGGTNGSFVAAGDVNGDSLPDLAVVGTNGFTGPDSMRILPGNGDGTFKTPIFYDLGNDGPVSVQIGDLDGDGLGDVTVDCALSRLHVFYGNGAHVTNKLSVPRGNILTDADRDGHLDLVAGQFSTRVGVMLNRGDGVLKHPKYYDGANGFTWFPTVGDFNNDGNIDMAMTNGTNPTVSWVLGNGDGSFQKFGAREVPNLGARIAAGDLKKDGFDELVVPTKLGFAILINDGQWPVKRIAVLHRLGSVGGMGAPQPNPPWADHKATPKVKPASRDEAAAVVKGCEPLVSATTDPHPRASDQLDLPSLYSMTSVESLFVCADFSPL